MQIETENFKFGLKYGIEKIVGHCLNQDKEIEKLTEAIKQLSLAPQPRSVKPYNIKSGSLIETKYVGGGYVETLNLPIEKIEELYALDLIIKAENEVIFKENSKNCEILIEFLIKLGLRKTKREQKKGSRKYQMVEVPCSWVAEIRNLYSATDDWPSIDNVYYRACSIHKKFVETKKEQELAEQRRIEMEKKEQAKTELIFKMKFKHAPEMEGVPTVANLIEALLQKDKYLRLSHYLMLNRGDWNDGPSYAKTGLRNFEIENPPDREIYYCINSKICNWEGDGRVFRDCEWNYDVIMNLANADLVTDYKMLKEFWDQF